MYDTFSAFGNILSCKVAQDADWWLQGLRLRPLRDGGSRHERDPEGERHVAQREEGLRGQVRAPQGEGEGAWREGQEVHQRVHQELWRGPWRREAQGGVLQVWQDHLLQSGEGPRCKG